MSRDSGIELDQGALAEQQKRNSSELDALARHVRDLEVAARQWNEDVRRQLEQIQTQPAASNGAAGGAAEEVQKRIVRLENHLGKIKGDSRVEAILLRMGEVERKLSEGHSDPLLNEIAHRLAALERDSMAGGSPSHEVVQKLADLEARVNQSTGQDPRTDDLILRVASFESMLKHPERSEAVADLRRQLAELESRIGSASGQESPEQLKELQDRLASLEERVATPAEGVSGEVQEQIEALRSQLGAAKPDPGDWEERLADVESRIVPAEAITGIEERLGDRIVALAEQINPLDGDTRLAQLGEQVDSLRAEIRNAQPSRESTALMARLEAVEEQLAETPAADWVDQLQQRLAKLEERTAGAVDDTRIDAVAAQLDELRARTAELRDARVDTLFERLNRLEAAEPAADASAELGELRDQLEELQARAAQARDARVDALMERVASLDSGAAQEELAAITTQLDELRGAVLGDDRLEALIERVETVEQRVADATPPEEIQQLNERISRAEMRTAEAASGSQVQELTQRVFELEQGEGPAEDPRVADVLLRVDELENKVHQQQDGAVDKRMARGFVELATRLKEVEERLAQGPSEEELASLAERLERDETAASNIAEVEDLRAQLTALQTAMADSDSSPAGLELEQRLAALEMRIAESAGADVSSELTRRVDHLEHELGARDTTAALAQASHKIDQLSARVEALGEQGVDGGGLAELHERLAALEAEGGAGAAVDLSSLTSRLDALEERPADNGVDAALQGIRERLAELEQAPRGGGGPAAEVDLSPLEARIERIEAGKSRVDPQMWEAMLEDIRERLGELEAQPGGGGAGGGSVDLSPIQERLSAVESLSAKVNPDMWEAMLEGVRDRLAALESGAGEGSSDGAGFDSSLLTGLTERLDLVEESAGGVSPAELAELRARIGELEARPAAAPDASALEAPLRGVAERIDALERRPAAGANPDLLKRIGELEDRIVQLASAGGGGGDLSSEALEQEKARWSKAFDQVVEHVRAIEDRLDDGGEGASFAPSGGGLQEVMTTLADRVGAALDRSSAFEEELRMMRSRMWWIVGVGGFFLFFSAFFLAAWQLMG